MLVGLQTVLGGVMIDVTDIAFYCGPDMASRDTSDASGNFKNPLTNGMLGLGVA